MASSSPKMAEFVATYCGLGLSPVAPGTVGSLGTLPLAYALHCFFGVLGLLTAAVICFVAGVAATNAVIRGQDEKDPGKVVIDEVVGQLLTLSFIPDYIYGNSVDCALAYTFGFALFRFFDICKMGPVKWCDTKIKNAFGVMLDDVFAGLFGGLLLWALISFIVADY